MHTAKHRGYEHLRDALVKWRAALRAPPKRRAAGLLINYVTDRREMIRYPWFLNEGWQIGSGPTESQCKQVPRRVKSGGKRWDADNAEAVMALEAMEQSNLVGHLLETLRPQPQLTHSRKNGQTPDGMPAIFCLTESTVFVRIEIPRPGWELPGGRLLRIAL